MAVFQSHVAALVRSHVNGLQPFESKIEQTTETMPPPSHKTITAATLLVFPVNAGLSLLFVLSVALQVRIA